MSELYHSLINESSISSTVSSSNNKHIIFIGPKCNKENDYLLETNKISSYKSLMPLINTTKEKGISIIGEPLL